MWFIGTGMLITFFVMIALALSPVLLPFFGLTYLLVQGGLDETVAVYIVFITIALMSWFAPELSDIFVKPILHVLGYDKYEKPVFNRLIIAIMVFGNAFGMWFMTVVVKNGHFGAFFGTIMFLIAFNVFSMSIGKSIIEHQEKEIARKEQLKRQEEFRKIGKL